MPRGRRPTPSRLLLVVVAVLSVLAAPWAAAAQAPAPSSAGDSGARFAGWATIAYPSLSTAELRAIFGRQQAAGANVIWLGHNNPGEVDATTAEPGLSYAVFEAFTDRSHPRYADARLIVQAQLRALSVARELGLKVVFPIGYQLQMGESWNRANAEALRRNAAGEVAYDTGVANASIYAPVTRRDLRRYYEWVDAFIVRPWRSAIVMLNLADEPGGGDYSAWADLAFQSRTGYGFNQVGDDPTRQIELGRFQSEVMVDFARWAAEQWETLAPGLPVTMSFEGATARLHHHLPNVEALFRQTPANFVPTFDAYPRDGPPEAIIDDATLVQLFHLVRTLGHYSARTDRPFWLWSSANSWGLAQASPRPGQVADAVANAYYLALLARQTGGKLMGIAVWNYNAMGQGLYNDTHRTVYDPEQMFIRVSESLPRVRELLQQPPGATRVLILAPEGLAFRLLGASRSLDIWNFRTYGIDRLLAPARNNVAAAIVPRLAGERFSSVRAIVVLARAPADLQATDVELLRERAAAGTAIVARDTLRAALGEGPLYTSEERVEELFSDSPSPAALAMWRRALDIQEPIQAYLVASDREALVYSLRPEQQTVQVRLPFAGRGHVYEPDGAQGRPLAVTASRVEVPLRFNQFAYLERPRATD